MTMGKWLISALKRTCRVFLYVSSLFAAQCFDVNSCFKLAAAAEELSFKVLNNTCCPCSDVTEWERSKIEHATGGKAL